MKSKMTLAAAAILSLTSAALADTAGPAPKAPGPDAMVSGFFQPFPFQGGDKHVFIKKGNKHGWFK